MEKEIKYTIINKKELSKCEIELEIEIPVSVLSNFRKEAVEAISQDINIDGFRKGHIPENIVLQEVGEMAIAERVAYRAINNIYPTILIDEKMNALTQPEITVTKIAPGSSLVFKAKIQLIPSFELPDYKKIAKEIKGIDTKEVTEAELNTYIDFIRSQKAQMMKLNKTEDENSAGIDNKKGDDKNSSLPELNDEFVKSLGNFQNVEEFKKEVMINMAKEKEQKEIERRRLEILEGIIKETEIDIPQILIDEELDRMLGEFKDRIKQMRMEPEDYFKEIKKTEEELKSEWKTDAEKRTKMNLILPKIAQKEKVTVDPKIVEKEVAHLKEHHKNLDEFRAKIYISNLLANEEVFKILEKIS